jgi:hypothetical protein
MRDKQEAMGTHQMRVRLEVGAGLDSPQLQSTGRRVWYSTAFFGAVQLFPRKAFTCADAGV